jgi:hypothetical protein
MEFTTDPRRLVTRLQRLTAIVTLCLCPLAMWAAGIDSQRGAELLQPFKQDLQAALKAGLADGPVAAIDACRIRAPEIAAELSRDGVRMGRTSHRLRNPANAGPAWATVVLRDYLADNHSREPVRVELGDGRIGYVEPIVTQPLCLTCHGDSLSPELQAALAAQYPDDRATGFAPGELRGVFWVEYPAP